MEIYSALLYLSILGTLDLAYTIIITKTRADDTWNDLRCSLAYSSMYSYMIYKIGNKEKETNQNNFVEQTVTEYKHKIRQIYHTSQKINI